MQPCVGGERDVKRVLLLIKNEDDRERWLGQLSRITLSREDPAQRPPSPIGNSRSLRPGSMRVARGRPTSAKEQRPPPLASSGYAASNIPLRAYSVSVRPEVSSGNQRPYATYSPSTSSSHRSRQPLPAELMNLQRSAEYGDYTAQSQ